MDMPGLRICHLLLGIPALAMVLAACSGSNSPANPPEAEATNTSADSAIGRWHNLTQTDIFGQTWNAYMPLDLKEDGTFVMGTLYYEVEPPHHGGGMIATIGSWESSDERYTLRPEGFYDDADKFNEPGRYPEFVLEHKDGQLVMTSLGVEDDEPHLGWVFTRKIDAKVPEVLHDWPLGNTEASE
ncbi:MAG: hypothetical protein IH944_05960 [Armatimonadetes bacterium]|nr:hypothetical protein [Armatimonadota bacterium]